jgi:gas vesicle protein
MMKDAREMDPEEFEQAHPNEWYLRREKVEKIMMEAMGRRAQVWGGNLQSKNFWIWGAPGVGKSLWATEQVPLWNQCKKGNNKWWDGYQICYTKVVILEDYPRFPQGDILQHHIKIWADRYPFIGEIKNGHKLIEPGRYALVITSNFSIEQCFSNAQDVAAISRRFNQIEMTKHNAVLIKSTKIDLELLNDSQKNREREKQNNGQEEMNEEEIEELQQHLEEVQQMEEAARRGAGMEDEW